MDFLNKNRRNYTFTNKTDTVTVYNCGNIIDAINEAVTTGFDFESGFSSKSEQSTLFIKSEHTENKSDIIKRIAIENGFEYINLKIVSIEE